VIGGVAPMEPDYGALPIDARTGLGGPGGDIRPVDSLAAFAQTLQAAVGVDATLIRSPRGTGKVVTAAIG
jgi:hypothetical protein